MEDVAELLVRDVALSEDVVVLEEFEKTNTVFFDLVLDLNHKSEVGLVVPCEVGPLLDVSGFQLGGWAVNGVFKAVSVLEELSVEDFILFGSVDGLNQSNFFL